MKEAIYEPEYVMGLFNRMSDSYERMNYITSFGFSIRWRRQFIQSLPGTHEPIKVLDLLCGMGETWQHLQNHFPGAEIHALDFSEGMLKRADKKNQSKFEGRIKLLQENALQSSLADNQYDRITCAFGLKTFNEEQLIQIAKEVNRLLKPKGSFSFIEVSTPDNYFLRLLYGFYLGRIIPVLGRLMLGNPAEYRMLWRYTRKFGTAKSIQSVFEAAGLHTTTVSYFNNCASGIIGSKND